MPKFRLLIHGINFHVELSDSDAVKPYGFYVNAFVEAESPEKAELVAVELIRKSPKLRGAVHNAADDPPRMFVDEIEEITDWPPDTVRPLTGLALYDEEAERNPSSGHSDPLSPSPSVGNLVRIRRKTLP